MIAWLALAHAQDAVRLEAVRTTQEGAEPASLSFVMGVSGQLDAQLTCAGRSYRLSERVGADSTVTLTLDDLPRGTHSCSGSLRLEESDGSSGEMPLSLEFAMLDALELEVDKARLDLDARSLVVTGSRPLQRVEIEVFDDSGQAVGSGALSDAGASELSLEWSQPDVEVLKLVLTGTDVHGLTAALTLSPWSYAIPHEDVHFATGKSEITEGEEPKLDHAYAELTEVLEKYGDIVEVKLFVAGYTDTVGDRASNQGLSEARAKAIASWFRARGFEGYVAYQGFGEDGLAVDTPDETDEVRNRRALYLLAAEQPPAAGELPRANWRPL